MIKIIFSKGCGIIINEKIELPENEMRRPRILREMMAMREMRHMMRFRPRNAHVQDDDLHHEEEMVMMMHLMDDEEWWKGPTKNFICIYYFHFCIIKISKKNIYEIYF